MDMSLDEIIKKKKVGARPNRKGFITKKGGRDSQRNEVLPQPRRIKDARIKIIQKNRLKIHDAREKLAQITKANGDARLRILKKRKDINPKPLRTANSYRTKNITMNKSKPKFFTRPKLPQMIPIPRGYVDYDNMEMEEEYQPLNVNLRRTVHNDIPTFSGYQSSDRLVWGNDPFDCYETPINRPPDVAEIRRQIRNMPSDLIPPKGILRSSRQFSPPPYSGGRYISEQPSHLSYEMRSRLEHAPDPHASMGIFANSPGNHVSSSSAIGFRIVVSNLHNSVTQSDIKELFEDIGELNEARLVRPGVAEVIFKNLKDAEKAVDTYHNRQLDGQPMKCLLVNPRSSNKPTAPAIKPSNSYSSRSSSSSNKTPLEIDIDALHKVLFRRH